METKQENVIPTDYAEVMQKSYIDYAMSVIISRALPDVRDGLKPVQRRTLYDMYELGIRYDRPYRKCARIVGDTIHKSQGLTFDKVLIESDRAFSHGQVYVALSRCRTLEGIRLLKPIPQSSLITDGEVSEFTEHVENNQPDEKALDRAVGNNLRRYRASVPLVDISDFIEENRHIGEVDA